MLSILTDAYISQEDLSLRAEYLLGAGFHPSRAWVGRQAKPATTLRMEPSAAERVVQAGTFRYDSQVECDIRVVHRPVRHGTCDSGDPSEATTEAEQNTFYVEYGSTSSRGVFIAGGGGFPTLSAAVAPAAGAPVVGSTFLWVVVGLGAGRAETGS